MSAENKIPHDAVEIKFDKSCRIIYDATKLKSLLGYTGDGGFGGFEKKSKINDLVLEAFMRELLLKILRGDRDPFSGGRSAYPFYLVLVKRENPGTSLGPVHWRIEVWNRGEHNLCSWWNGLFTLMSSINLLDWRCG
jgi:hypothetical protein